MTPNHDELRSGSIAVVLGTRPEIIKLGHVIRLLGDAASILHTGQHYDTGLSQTFFDAFDLPQPAAFLGVGGDTRGAQIGKAVTALDQHLDDGSFSAVVVQGDTNSALAGAIAANAREIPLVHVESGLRSFDRRMPEEHNRVLVDHLTDLCAAPTEVSRGNLRSEGIPDERIVVTGNTVVEAVESLVPDGNARSELLERYRVARNGFVLSTFHRPENVDDPSILRVVLEQLAHLPLPVLLPIHPRTAGRIASDDDLARAAEGITTIQPIGYEDFLGLSAECAMLVSDSGGVQEEASVLKRPVLVVRRSTERPEVIGTFAERVEPGPGISEVAGKWLADLEDLHERLADTPTPYGDGTASQTIVSHIPGLLDA